MVSIGKIGWKPNFEEVAADVRPPGQIHARTRSETKAQELADELTPLIAEQPGCPAVTVFEDHSDGEYGIYVLWDTQEHADAAAELVRPQLGAKNVIRITRPGGYSWITPPS